MSPTRKDQQDRRWLVLAVLGIAQLMVVLDVTIVNIALPSAQADLHFADDDRQWIITAYALAFGSLLLLGGRISDLFGRKRTFIAGLGGFAVASAIGGMAGSFEVLVAARALQGLFGALLAPAALSLVTTTFTDPAERGKAFGIFGALAGSGSAIGLLLGGMLTEWLSWRWCLYVNLFFAAVAIAGAMALLAPHVAERRPRLDLPGTATATSGLFALVYGFTRAEQHGWGDGLTLALFAAALVLLGGFVVLQRRVANPLLPLRVVLDRDRGGAYLAIGIAGVAIFGSFLFLTFFLQQNLGYSPIETGLSFLPMTASIVLTATLVSTRVLPRSGAKPLVAGGMVLGAAGMVLFAQLDTGATYAADVLPGLIVLGIGFGQIVAPGIATATHGVRPQDAGVASAMVNTAQQIGGSIGTALLSTLAASAASDFIADAGGRPSPALAGEAAVHGFTTAFTWAAAIFIVGAVVCGLLLRADTRPAHGEAPGEPAMAH